MKITKKAFTLIELMIVVVILWVLMSTVLPKLTWAQARSRDAWRIADIWNIAAALQVYYDDNGQFPTAWSWSCLMKTADTDIAGKLKWYMQSEKVPTDPQPTANSFLCDGADDSDTAKWWYFYQEVTKNWLDNNAYKLCADMETLQKANTDAGSWSLATSQDYVALSKLIWNASYDEEDTDWANQSVYCILRP
jgi:prepilin-type N-terminal cleavage/methylation domain-containing protein